MSAGADIDIKPFLCNLCGDAFQQKSAMVAHQRVHSDDDSDMNVLGDTDTKPFACNLCGYIFQEECALVDHQRVHNAEQLHINTGCQDTGDKPSVCDIHGEAFQQECAQGNHWHQVHGDEKLDIIGQACNPEKAHTNSGTFVCGIHNGRRHTEREQQPIVVDSDHARCSSRDQERHRRSYAEEDIFTCHVCGKDCPSRTSLVYHKASHFSAMKQFVCDICGKAFIWKSQLKCHERSHTKEKPFVCECGKAYSWKKSLKNHQRTHTDNNYVVCDCGKGFPLRSSLQLHQRECPSFKNGFKIKVKQESHDDPKMRVLIGTKYGHVIEV